MSRVDIGFAEDCESWQVESSLFPSKIGGKPAWLDLQNLPTAEIICQSCKAPMIFLCQVYAPYEEDSDNFHRTLFVFICRNSKCCVVNDNNNMMVLRSHLKRDNVYYSSQPPNVDEPSQSINIKKFVSLCEVCGCFATKRCSKCKETAYCSREHQVIDWKDNHKANCGNNYSTKSKLLFDEYEMVVEPEEIEETQVDEEKEIEKFSKLELEGKTGTLKELSETELDAHDNIIEDKVFMAFQKRISGNKDQVLRYERGGMPLWIAQHLTPVKIPPCEYCCSDRQFEFQIMPQMLTVLKETNIDWGVLAIFSCKQSCSKENGYKKEFIYKQDISET